MADRFRLPADRFRLPSVQQMMREDLESPDDGLLDLFGPDALGPGPQFTQGPTSQFTLGSDITGSDPTIIKPEDIEAAQQQAAQQHWSKQKAAQPDLSMFTEEAVAPTPAPVESQGLLQQILQNPNIQRAITTGVAGLGAGPYGALAAGQQFEVGEAQRRQQEQLEKEEAYRSRQEQRAIETQKLTAKQVNAQLAQVVREVHAGDRKKAKDLVKPIIRQQVRDGVTNIEALNLPKNVTNLLGEEIKSILAEELMIEGDRQELLKQQTKSNALSQLQWMMQNKIEVPRTSKLWTQSEVEYFDPPDDPNELIEVDLSGDPLGKFLPEGSRKIMIPALDWLKFAQDRDAAKTAGGMSDEQRMSHASDLSGRYINSLQKMYDAQALYGVPAGQTPITMPNMQEQWEITQFFYQEHVGGEVVGERPPGMFDPKDAKARILSVPVGEQRAAFNMSRSLFIGAGAEGALKDIETSIAANERAEVERPIMAMERTKDPDDEEGAPHPNKDHMGEVEREIIKEIVAGRMPKEHGRVFWHRNSDQNWSMAMRFIAKGVTVEQEEKNWEQDVHLQKAIKEYYENHPEILSSAGGNLAIAALSLPKHLRQPWK